MAHANKTYTSSGGSVGLTSLFPTGNAPAPSTGIAYSGSPIDGSIIKVLAGSDVDFGNDVPDFLCYYHLKNAPVGGFTAGTRAWFEATSDNIEQGYLATKGTAAHYTGSDKMPVLPVSTMPYGKGIGLGSLNEVLQGTQAGGVPNFSSPTNIFGQLEIVSATPSETAMVTYYSCWPEDEQRNTMENSVKNEQDKQLWFYSGATGYNGGPGANDGTNSRLNLYVGLPSGSGGGTRTGWTYTINSSTSVTITSSGQAAVKFLDAGEGDIGKTVTLSNLSSVGNAGNAVVASISTDSVNLTVSGWPSSGSGTLDVLKKGTMQSTNRVVRANQAAFIANSNTDYLLTKQGTIADPYTIDSTHQRSGLITQQVLMRSETPTNLVYCRVLDAVDGEIYNYAETHPRVGTLDPAYDKFDYFHFQGNSQGFNTFPIAGNPISSRGKSPYASAVFVQLGSAARGTDASVRVELATTQTPTTGDTKVSPCRILSMTNKVAVIQLYEGVFEGLASLSGLWLRFYKKGGSSKEGVYNVSLLL